MKIKPGYKTSEFWFTLVSFIFSGLYLIGLFGEDAQQKEDLIRDVSHGVESVILIGGQLALLFRYINGRKQIKETFYQQNNTNPSNETLQVEGVKNVRNKSRKPKKPSKPRTRKSSNPK
jgi:hypothetical protein